MRINHIKKRRTLATAVSVAVTGVMAYGMLAPASMAAEPTAVEEVVVTGSRIRRQTTLQNIVVTDIDAAQMDLRGFNNAIESLEQLPFVSVGVNNQGNNTQFGDNNAFVNLLNLGSQRTVTLIDGRRFVSSNQGTVFVPGNATGAQVDLTIINPSLIKRTEVQTIGSGAVYGPDAIAGVVNVQLDREFEGVEVITQYGMTSESDGTQKRLSLAWGDELFQGRGHLVLGGEYLTSDPIYYGDGRSWTNNIFSINNPYSTGNTDGVANTIFQEELIGTGTPLGGRMDLRQINAGNSATFLFPRSCIAAQTTNIAACNTFTAQRGNNPFDFGVLNAGNGNSPQLAGLNPLAFVGTFGLTSGFPTLPATAGSPEALAGLSRVAVPLTFDAGGNPIPLSLGQYLPPNVAAQNQTVNAGGFDTRDLQTIQAGQERYSFNGFFSFDLTDSLRYEGDLLYSEVENFQHADSFGSNSPAGSFTAGTAGIPVYYNQNPFVTTATRNQINALIAGNATSPFTSVGGQPVFYLQRSLADITGSRSGAITNFEGNDSTTISTGHTLKQDFDFLARDLYWEATVAYGLNESDNNAATDLLDIEFWLATDVVRDANGRNVCRQQTLAAPEAVNVRNPYLTNINIATGIVPTKAQIDACVPLNLLGAGLASPEAISYVTAKANSANKAEQTFASVQLGGELLTLPAGEVLFNTELQWRKEELEFTPNRVSQLGLARTTISQPGLGYAEFREAGTEVSVPIFGGDLTTLLLRELRLDAAVRVVDREGEGTPNGISNPAVKTDTGSATTFNIGGIWAPFDWVTFRGNRSRSVRSPSIVETLGAPQTGFSTLAGSFPCNGNNRNLGPASGIRLTNCDAFEKKLGLPAGTFAGLFPSTGSVPAGVGGNPGLENEVATNWTAGFVIEPSFVEGMQIQADYLSILLEKQIGLTFLGTQCFDQTDYPLSLIGGVSSCEAITLATGTGAGGLAAPYTIPTTNIITGNPIKPPAITGAPSTVQAPYTIATAQFSNANQGSIRLQGINTRISYAFNPQDLLAPFGVGNAALGQMRVDAYVYVLNKFQTSSSGTFGADTNNNRGEPGYEKVQSRVDLSHQLGRFTHQLQWFRAHGSQGNVDITPTAIPEQNAAFFRPAYDRFNYNMSYSINDNLTARVVVNNIFNDLLLPEYGLAGDAIGRNFLVRLDARF
jgi:outer membrane receptor protein involved in Fe transport